MSKITVKFIKQTVANGLNVKVGQIMDLEPSEARFLVKINRAVFHTEEELAPVEPELVAEESPLVETEKKPLKKSKK